MNTHHFFWVKIDHFLFCLNPKDLTEPTSTVSYAWVLVSYDGFHLRLLQLLSGKSNARFLKDLSLRIGDVYFMIALYLMLNGDVGDIALREIIFGVHDAAEAEVVPAR